MTCQGKIRLALLLLLSVALMPAGLADAQTIDVQPQGQARQQVDSLQAQADAITAEITAQDRDLEVVVEQHNATRVSLDQLTMKLADSRANLDDMTAKRNEQERMLSSRLTNIYKAGDINIMSILLNSTSFNDFLEQAQYIVKINQQDLKLEQEFEASAEAISETTDNIDRQRAEQMRLEKDLADQQAVIESRINERQQKLNDVNGQVQQILRQEQARQQAEAAREAAETASMLQDLQISDATQAQAVETALHYLGVPYVWGGESPAGFDCSGLTKFVLAQHGVELPHNAAMQFALGAPVPRDQLQPGDLVFFGPLSPHHVGMYVGKGKFIEAPTFGEVVRVSTLVFDSDYAGARRYPLQPRLGPPR